MKTRLLLLPLLALLVFAACDSNDDEASDLDALIGNHMAVKIEDDAGDQTATFAQIVNAFTVVVRADETYSLNIDYNALAEAAGKTDVALAGGYSVNQSAKTFTIRGIPIPGTTATTSVSFDYEILPNNQVRFTTPAAPFNLILGTQYEGDLKVTVQRQPTM